MFEMSFDRVFRNVRMSAISLFVARSRAASGYPHAFPSEDRSLNSAEFMAMHETFSIKTMI
jgi:hypothetical protein